MAPPDRILIAHDLPMSLAEAADELKKLGEGWYMPRNPFAQIDELLVQGTILIEREGATKVSAFLHAEGGEVVLNGIGEDTSGALAELYRKLVGGDGT